MGHVTFLHTCPHMTSEYTQMRLLCGRVPTLSSGREVSAKPSAWCLHLQLDFPARLLASSAALLAHALCWAVG